MGERYVVTIGIAKYADYGPDRSWSWLPGVNADRVRFKETLKVNADNRGVNDFIDCFDEAATKAEIKAKLTELSGVVRATDQLVIYFGGHGACLKDPVTKRDEYYLIPHDAAIDSAATDGLSTQELGTILEKFKALELIVILDCCHSGGVGVGLAQFTWNERTLAAMRAGFVQFYAMAAASGYQELLDGNHGSFFTQTLCDALEGKGINPASGAITVGLAFQHAKRESRRLAVEYLRGQYRILEPTAVAAGNGDSLILTAQDSTLTALERAYVLDKLSEIWIEGELKTSLFRGVALELELHECVGAVIRPWAQTTPLHQTSRPLPKGTSIVDIYQDMATHTLLILGGTGSGKTNLLLNLLKVILDEAKRDSDLPIPMVFQLRYWEKGMPLQEWFSSQLSKMGFVPAKQLPGWLNRHKILPLLLGLHKVDKDQQAACVAAINQFRNQEHGLQPMVVSCNKVDYSRLGPEGRLVLEKAYGVKPLARQKVTSYLLRLGPAGQPLLDALEREEVLWELMASPQLLNLALKYVGESGEQLPVADTIEETREQFLSACLNWMVRSGGAESGYRREQILHWLTWLAKNSLKHGHPWFCIENLQPDWLSTRHRRWFAPAVVLVTGLGIGSVVGLLCGIVYGAAWGLPMGILAGMGAMCVAPTIEIYGVINARKHLFQEIECSEATQWSWSHAKAALLARRSRRAYFAAALGSIVGLLRGMMIYPGQGEYYATRSAAAFALGFFVSGWLFHGFFDLIRGGLHYTTIATKEKRNEGIRTILRNACLYSLIYFLLGGLLMAPGICLTFWSMNALELAPHVLFAFSFTFALSGFLLHGGSEALKHLILRTLLARSGDAPFRYRKFLDFSVERHLLYKFNNAYEFAPSMLDRIGSADMLERPSDAFERERKK
jgi:hypothetical protein